MREHQIVITLKPDQFLEVQRLARAANAKSMGIFVRQKLLAALGIEGSLNAGEAGETTGANVEGALVQVRRLHAELKTFVAESLSLYNMEMADGAAQPIPTAEASSGPVQTASDALEHVAERTFAISPRLGPIGQSAAGDEAAEATSGRRTARTESVPPQPSGEQHRHEPHRRDQHRYLHPHAASELMDVPFAGTTAPAKAQLLPGDRQPPVPSSPAPVISDPLEKLLPSDAEFRPSSQSPPQPQPSLLASVSPDQVAQPPAPPSPSFYFIDGEPAQSMSAQSPQTTEEPHSVAMYVEEETPAQSLAPAADDADASANAGSTNATSESSSNAPSVRRPLDYPSFSGSPPPKRRQV